MEQTSIARQPNKIAALSRPTWFAMFLVSLPLAIIVVPGEFVYPWPDETGELNAWKLRSNELRAIVAEQHEKEFGHRPTTLQVYEHGWPKPFLARAVVFNCNDRGQTRSPSKPLLGIESWFRHWGGASTLSVSWSDYDVWPFYADDWIIDVWGLLIDGFTAAAIVLTVGVSTNWWLKSRRGKRGTFQLREILLLVTLVAIVLGIYAYHTRIRSREGLAGKWLPPGFKLHDGHMLASQSYVGPNWLRKLSGNDHYPQLFAHVTHATIRDNDHWTECYDELLNFPYLHTLKCREEVPRAAFEILTQCPHLRNLTLTFKTTPNQNLNSTAGPTMSVEQLHWLDQLQLQSIALHGDQIEARHIEQLAEHPNLERVILERTSVSEEAIEMIRKRFPALRIEVIPNWNSGFASG